eukprot:TRINITY_DN409_c0_g1_i1.p1 TRINITY_DN409_c0_g1~~TRINITY_DN409_c0_g1_i1.p1  ORF type:complete len:312 (-),score=62.55 TRINITY_DN409_c0_g1_i1:58-993(-)
MASRCSIPRQLERCTVKMASKIAEAEQLVKEGDKLTTKGILRWKADWDGAVSLYEKAATNFKNAKENTRAKNAYKKAATCYENLNIPFSAGKNLDNAGDMAKVDRDNDEAVQLWEQAAAFYSENASPDKAAETLIKAAKVIEDSNAEKCMQLVGDACSIFEVEEREQFAPNTFKYAIGVAIKQNKFDQALEYLGRLGKIHTKLKQTHDMPKIHLSAIIIHLKRDDYVSADRVYQEFISTGGMSSPEVKVAAELLEAYEKADAEALKTCLGRQAFTFLDNNVAKLSRSLKVPGQALKTTSSGTVVEEEIGLA